MGRLTRRAALLGGIAAIGVWAAGRFGTRTIDATGTTSLVPDGAPGTLNDASRLSQTPVFRHITLREDVGELLVNRLRGELDEARVSGRPVLASAARHSMGGQSIPAGGHAITCDNGFVEPDTANGTCRVHAGARWHQVIAALDPLGFSPKVMQSNSDFGVAASFSVNAHGWPVPQGPVGSTVRALRMVTHSGEWITCSRDENADLFAMAMGGYGLVGLITDLTLDMVANRRLAPEFTRAGARAIGAALVDAAADPLVEMAHGRLNVARGRFLDEGLLVAWRDDGDQGDLPLATGPGALSDLSRRMLRAQVGREAARRARWLADTTLRPLIAGTATRNTLLNRPAAAPAGADPGRTEILHGYFMPPERLVDFIALCQRLIPASRQELLDLTLRFVAADTESWLSYAPGPRIAVMPVFSQDMTARAEADMARLTRALIEGVLELGGAPYLPCRPHATPGQILRAYPRAAEFAAMKRRIDPDLRFRNALWDRVLAEL